MNDALTRLAEYNLRTGSEHYGTTEVRIARFNDNPSRFERYVVAIYTEKQAKRYGHPKGTRAWRRDRFFDCPLLAQRFAANAA